MRDVGMDVIKERESRYKGLRRVVKVGSCFVVVAFVL